MKNNQKPKQPGGQEPFSVSRGYGQGTPALSLVLRTPLFSLSLQELPEMTFPPGAGCFNTSSPGFVPFEAL